MLIFYTRNKKYIYVANGQIQAAGHAHSHACKQCGNVQLLITAGCFCFPLQPEFRISASKKPKQNNIEMTKSPTSVQPVR